MFSSDYFLGDSVNELDPASILNFSNPNILPGLFLHLIASFIP